jgi:hypothetical protein
MVLWRPCLQVVKNIQKAGEFRIMSKLVKILMLSLTLLLTLTSLVGCSNSKQPEETTNVEPQVVEEVDLATTYDLTNIDKVSVWYLGTVDNGGYTLAFEITDSADIQKMIEAVDFPSWEKNDEVYSGVIEYYIQFNDAATIATYGETPYGFIGQGAVEKDGKMVKSDGSEVIVHGDYNMPRSILDAINVMIEKYKPELLLN